MSTRKRPLSELHNHNAPTPTRRWYPPSTPHAIRALQERRVRSAAHTKTIPRDAVRPDSARGVLRRLAKITAPLTKRTVDSAGARGKENQWPSWAEDDEDHQERPRATLDVDDSTDGTILEMQLEEDEDSELPAAPTPSILPHDDDEQPTITFKSIDFARHRKSLASTERIDRPRSRVSMLASDPERHEDDHTILSEMGRRAISEEPTGRLSRYSFGSIRMSDFGSELEIRRESDQRLKHLELQDEYDGMGFGEEPLDLDGETEDLRRLQSPSLEETADESTVHVPIMNESFQLELPEEHQSHPLTSKHPTPMQFGRFDDGPDDSQPRSGEGIGDHGDSDVDGDRSPRQRTGDDGVAAPSTVRRRRKRLKMTRHGTMIPSLPSSVIKRVAIESQIKAGYRKPRLGNDHIKALEQATEWFFEQVGEDLEAYANHARRKKRVDGTDVLLLMRRQKVLRGHGELKKMAREWLSKEAASELELPDNL